jgi:hypothetical protein
MTSTLSGIRSYVSSGIAVISVGAFVAAPASPEAGSAPPRQPAVALAAQVQPLIRPILVPAPLQVTGLLNEQVAFHIDLAVDFVAKGARLIGRQIPVPGTLLGDIQEGTPLPVAVTRALTTMADVELDAGRELVGFATRYVDFQVRFVAGVVQNAVVLAATVPAAVSQFAAAAVAGAMPAPNAEPAISSAVETVSTTRRPTTASSDDDDPTERHADQVDKADKTDDETSSGTGQKADDGRRQSSAADDDSSTDETAGHHDATNEPKTHKATSTTSTKDDDSGRSTGSATE